MFKQENRDCGLCNESQEEQETMSKLALCRSLLPLLNKVMDASSLLWSGCQLLHSTVKPDTSAFKHCEKAKTVVLVNSFSSFQTIL